MEGTAVPEQVVVAAVERVVRQRGRLSRLATALSRQRRRLRRGTCVALGCLILGTLTSAAQAHYPSGWSISSVPKPAGTQRSTLSGVSCASATFCLAVGSFSDARGTFALAERWNGQGWAIQRTPNPAGSRRTALKSVSCTSKWACTAVGSFSDASGTFALAERWNGLGWAIQRTPNPPGSKRTVLNGVSCTPSTVCTAVGSFRNGTYALAERWRGSTWSIQPTATDISIPASESEATLNAVSCTATTNCMAVGSHFFPGADYCDVVLVEHWDGMGWSTLPVPCTDTLAYGSDLLGVSCVSPSACATVGNSPQEGSGVAPLAAHWNGSSWSEAWTLLHSRTPGGVFDGIEYDLASVSCTAASACSAVGTTICNLGTTCEVGTKSYVLPFVERLSGTKWSIDRVPNLHLSLLGVSCRAGTTCVAVGHNERTAASMVLRHQPASARSTRFG